MCICSDRLAVQDCEMHYINAWLKRCVFNLDLNRESVSEPRTLSGRLFQSLGARYEKVLPPLVDFAILGTTNGAFPLHGTVRFGTARYGTVRLSSGRFAFPLQFSTAIEWAGLFTCHYNCAASTAVTSS